MITGAARHYAQTYGEGSPQHVASLSSRSSRKHIDRAKVEPRVAEMLFNELVAKEQRLTVHLGHVVVEADRDGPLIRSVALEPLRGDFAPGDEAAAITVGGTIFADAMYEGDLMAAAGVKTQIGRESRAHYGEWHAGILQTKPRPLAPGHRGFSRDADQGRLNLRTFSFATGDVVDGPHSGESDGSVMAYNYRLILTMIR